MKILKAELIKGEIHVEALLDGEVIKRKFQPDVSVEQIKDELNASEENIKTQKAKKEAFAEEAKVNAIAENTISGLIS